MKSLLLMTAALAGNLGSGDLDVGTLKQEGLMPPGLPGVGELGGPGRQLSGSELDQFLRGRAIFDKNFHRDEGLGTPEMNADSCRACHQDPVMGGSGALELNVFRAAYDNGGQGPYQDVNGGQAFSKLRPPWVDGREDHPLEADVFEQRQTPAVFGGGLIDSISAAEILSREDPDDTNQDGIRGVARRINVGGRIEIGRWGWKGQIPLSSDFIKDAMAGECGITTPDDGRGFALLDDADMVDDPELSQADFEDIAFFLAELGAPPRGGSSDPRVPIGEAIFSTIGCDRCHTPVQQGEGGPVPLYSDLLLHDVMPVDFRGMQEPQAGAGVFRTTPLWGVRNSAPYLHDGRAETLEDAILMHVNDAHRVRKAYTLLPAAEQEALILFLEDL